MYARGGTRALTLTMTRANGVHATAGDQQLQEEETQ
jgi:hypothetical protein